MSFCKLILLSFLLLVGLSTTSYAAQKRCGWFDNPTPNNAWLTDKDGEWIVSVQGGFQADGDWPDFEKKPWVDTNGSYGYGCACMKVETDHENMHITKIISSKVKPISVCRKDKTLPKHNP